MMGHMNQVRLRFVLFPVFMFPIGLMLSSHSAESYLSRAGLTCSQQRLVSFGYPHQRVALAEMAAIIVWQKQAVTDLPGYGKWPLAQGRNMKCRFNKSSKYYRCQVSATPCRIKKGKEKIS